MSTDQDKMNGSANAREAGGTEFYVGWQTAAPRTYTRHIRRVVASLVVGSVVVSTALALYQHKFSTAVFEFGKLTKVNGIYISTPVPGIKVVKGRDIFGNLNYLTIPLVGYGKRGAEGIISNIEKTKKISLAGKQITLQGTLLYNDGKTLMQVEAKDGPVSHVGTQADHSLLPVRKELGIQTIKGEIIDPKCYFGVMKPGEGKAHKDCAIRCILGGIPPVFHVRNEQGVSTYYLMVGINGAKMNLAVKNFVGQPVTITARVSQSDDWKILYIGNASDIQPYSYIGTHLGSQVLSCVVNCVQ